MKLAIALGRTLDELEQTISAQEFGMWAALNAEDPWDYSRADVNAGVIASTVANYAGKIRKEHSAPASPIDFMPFHKRVENDAPDAVDPAEHFGAFLKS